MVDTPYPRLDDIVKADDVAIKGGGNFAASYVNWAKIAYYLREHAPGWQPRMLPVEGQDVLEFVHRAPDGSGFLLIYFQHRGSGVITAPVPHAIMDNRNNAKKQIDARDVSDAFVRGMCKAAALLFGLGWKLWSKDDPMEREEGDAPPPSPKKQSKPAPKTSTSATEAQCKAIYAISMKLGWDNERRAQLLAEYGVMRSTELNRKQASEILDDLKKQEEAM